MKKLKLITVIFFLLFSYFNLSAQNYEEIKEYEDKKLAELKQQEDNEQNAIRIKASGESSSKGVEETIGGDLVEGTLKIEFLTSTDMQVYRYTNSVWIKQYYADGNKGTKLHISGSGESYASGYYWESGTNFWDTKTHNKIDNYNHELTMTE